MRTRLLETLGRKFTNEEIPPIHAHSPITISLKPPDSPSAPSRLQISGDPSRPCAPRQFPVSQERRPTCHLREGHKYDQLWIVLLALQAGLRVSSPIPRFQAMQDAARGALVQATDPALGRRGGGGGTINGVGERDKHKKGGNRRSILV